MKIKGMILTVCLMAMLACSSGHTTTNNNNVNNNSTSQSEYTLFRPERTSINENGQKITDVALYHKKGDTNHVYIQLHDGTFTGTN